jgi:Fe2+ or Zn2+ uptake regulation protein
MSILWEDYQPDDGTVEELFDTIEKNHGFHVITRHLALFGYCPECLAKMKKE